LSAISAVNTRLDLRVGAVAWMGAGLFKSQPFPALSVALSLASS